MDIISSTTLTVLGDDDDVQIQNPNTTSSYVLNGNITLCSVILLVVVVVISVYFHSCARWLFRHRHRRAHQLFFLSTTTSTTNPSSSSNVNTAQAHQAQAQALDLSVLKRLPTFVYSSKTHDRALSCTVCLSEFEDNEKGRVLPTCKHAFHADCIDMWFRSHSNCPLCRIPVQLPPAVKEVVSVIESAGSVSSDTELGVHQMG